MNRYRTVPGLGPSSSKATPTTTCQKCLKKGHYSYECKASVQSRPYTSRPSRSQQLQNPKLKPKLAEHKMEVPERIGGGNVDAPVSSGTRPDTELDTSKKNGQDNVNKSRSRSASLSSSVSSVATISTAASPSEAMDSMPATRRHVARHPRSRSISSSRSASDSPRPRRNPHEQRASHRSDVIQDDQPDRHAGTTLDSSPNASHSEKCGLPAVRTAGDYGRGDASPDDRHSRGQQRKRRRSWSPVVSHDAKRQYSKPGEQARQRSLSPYSRRLALTQAMNAGT